MIHFIAAFAAKNIFFRVKGDVRTIGEIVNDKFGISKTTQ